MDDPGTSNSTEGQVAQNCLCTRGGGDYSTSGGCWEGLGRAAPFSAPPRSGEAEGGLSGACLIPQSRKDSVPMQSPSPQFGN